MIDKYYVGKAHWNTILYGWMEKFAILGPLKEPGGIFLQLVTPENSANILYDHARAVQPLKSFLIPPLDEVTGEQTSQEKPWLFLGVKACELASLSILDQAYGGDYADPLYQKRRDDSIIVSSDCTLPSPSCFCTLLGGTPYPEKGFDLNLSKVWDGFVLEVGSPKGRIILEGFDEALKEVVKEEDETREKVRSEAIQKVKSQNEEFNFKADLIGLISGSWNSEVWKKYSETCVECGACNHACPTCHCYFLDDVAREDFVRIRGWDACQYSGYAVTAGGGTPRPDLYERFRNRYFCKFRYLFKNYGDYGCTGCGRCIDGCQGKIDLRSVLTELTNS